MNYRTATILAATDVNASGTKDMEIKIRDVISRITIRFAPTKTKEGMNSYAHKNITKIELKGDGVVLFGMDGGQAQALAIYDRKCGSLVHEERINALPENAFYPMDFGRRLFDPQLGLDPKKFDSLILYVTYDEDVSDTGATVNAMEVWADCFDEKAVSPIGFLRSLEHDSRTPPSAGYDYISLPTDKTLRKLLLQGYRAGYEPYYQVSEARLDEDNEKRIPFDWDLDKYTNLMRGIWTPIAEKLVGYGKGEPGYIYYMTPSEYYVVPSFTSASGSANNTINIIGFAYMRGGKLTVYGATTEPFVGIVTGYLPNHCFEFPFGDPMDIDDWYALRPEMDLRLRIKAGSGGANGTVATILQQLQRY